MRVGIHEALLVGAIISEFLAAIGVASRVNLEALGLLLWMLTLIV